jgi:HK97 family phage prohead protease
MMPVDITDKFIWIAVRDSGTFVQDSFREITLSEEQGIHARIGKLSSDPEGSTVIQSYYFDKDKWDLDKAKAWVKDHKKSSPNRPERRCIEYPVRMNFDTGRQPKVEGYAAVFNTRTELFPGFYEEVASGAFTDAIRSTDIYALWNHNPSDVLGNTGAETLRLSEDEHGLKYEIIPPDTTLGRDLQVLIKRGDIRKSSFGFNIDDEKVTKLDNGKSVLRTILRVKPLFDVSPVTYPAYKETDVHVRMIAGEKEIAYLFEDTDQLIVNPIGIDQPVREELSDDNLFKQIEELRKNYH